VTVPSSGIRAAGAVERIGITAAVLEAMIAHARRDAPRECCGLLVGTATRIDEATAVPNLEAGTTRYQIDPAAHFAAIKRVRGTKRDVVGAYHSHPRSPAVPSPTDIAEAVSAAFIYVIVSLAVAERPDTRAYRIADAGAVELQIDVL
jgi:proteasome lid subunit RPN8/RPN11